MRESSWAGPGRPGFVQAEEPFCDRDGLLLQVVHGAFGGGRIRALVENAREHGHRVEDCAGDRREEQVGVGVHRPDLARLRAFLEECDDSVEDRLGAIRDLRLVGHGLAERDRGDRRPRDDRACRGANQLDESLTRRRRSGDRVFDRAQQIRREIGHHRVVERPLVRVVIEDRRADHPDVGADIVESGLVEPGRRESELRSGQDLAARALGLGEADLSGGAQCGTPRD